MSHPTHFDLVPVLDAHVVADVALPVRVAATLNQRWLVHHLPNGSAVRVFGPPIEGRYQTTYRRVFCPSEWFHGCFVVESIAGLKLLQIFEMGAS